MTLEFENFYLISVYTSNSGDGLKRLKYRIEEWEVNFQNYVKSLEGSKAVIVGGDLNVAHNEIDIYDPKGKDKIPGFAPEERQTFGNFLQEKEYVDTYRHFYPDGV